MTTDEEKFYRFKFLKDFLPGFGVLLLLGMVSVGVATAVQTAKTSSRMEELLQRTIALDSVRPASRARWERIEQKVDAILLNQAQGQTRAVIRDSKIDTIKSVLLTPKHKIILP